MVEIFNADRTECLGRFADFKSAKDTLNGLATSGKLGEIPVVLVCSYKGNILRREYVATRNGNVWKVPAPSRQEPAISPRSSRRKRRRQHRCKVYKSHVQCFKEGFPDWLGKVYQPL